MASEFVEQVFMEHQQYARAVLGTRDAGMTESSSRCSQAGPEVGRHRRGPAGHACSKCDSSVQSKEPCTLTMCQADGKGARSGPGLALHGPQAAGKWSDHPAHVNRDGSTGHWTRALIRGHFQQSLPSSVQGHSPSQMFYTTLWKTHQQQVHFQEPGAGRRRAPLGTSVNP